jgi:hypothetical protein
MQINKLIDLQNYKKLLVYASYFFDARERLKYRRVFDA